MPEQKYSPVTHVIFDLDGLLINSEVLFAKAIDILLKRYGLYQKSICFIIGLEVLLTLEKLKI